MAGVKGAASVTKLAELHKELAAAHLRRLEQDKEDGVFTDAATLSSIAKFLADNQVFADVAEQDDLADLREQFAARSAERKAKRKAASNIIDLASGDVKEA